MLSVRICRELGVALFGWMKLLGEGVWSAAAPCFDSRLFLLSAAARRAPPGGLWLEFGVHRGESINHLALITEQPVFGFDSFEGIPEPWNLEFGKAAFSLAGKLPEVRGNVNLIQGWFSDTLPEFVRSHAPFRVSLLHVDCDLYSSAKTVLEGLREQIHPGTVIVFDEFSGSSFPKFQNSEARAFREFVAANGSRFRVLGYSLSTSVAVEILGPSTGPSEREGTGRPP